MRRRQRPRRGRRGLRRGRADRLRPASSRSWTPPRRPASGSRSAGAGGAEYLYVAYSAAGEESRDGTSAEYQLTGTAGTPPPAAVVRPGPRRRRFRGDPRATVPRPAQGAGSGPGAKPAGAAAARPGRALGAGGGSVARRGAHLQCAAQRGRVRDRAGRLRAGGEHRTLRRDPRRRSSSTTRRRPRGLHPGRPRRHRQPVRRPSPPDRRERLRERDRRERRRSGPRAPHRPGDPARGMRAGAGRGGALLRGGPASRTTWARTTPRSSTA